MDTSLFEKLEVKSEANDLVLYDRMVEHRKKTREFLETKGFRGNLDQLDFFELLKFSDLMCDGKYTMSIGEVVETMGRWICHRTNPTLSSYHEWAIHLFHESDFLDMMKQAHQRGMLIPDRDTTELICYHLIGLVKYVLHETIMYEGSEEIQSFLLDFFSPSTQDTVTYSDVTYRLCDHHLRRLDLVIFEQLIMLYGDPVVRIIVNHSKDFPDTDILGDVYRISKERTIKLNQLAHTIYTLCRLPISYRSRVGHQSSASHPARIGDQSNASHPILIPEICQIIATYCFPN